ncbi:MAG: efflux RND transporter periplasmic adaptor subunit [Akkermansia sp.]|nr:efflux RND transporter periplasmic adaptor subunit [Akkermansia sp.]
MKITLFSLFIALVSLPLSAHEGCGHDHAEHEHTHAEEAEHHHDADEDDDDEEAHEEHEHHHAGCTHEHADHEHDHGEKHEHSHEGCTHEHAGHDHAEGEEHEHAHEGCTHDHGHEGHDHSHGDGGTAVVKVDEHSRHVLAMQLEAVPETSATLTHSMYGTLTMPEHATETYALPCGGFLSLKVKSAQTVQKGDVLYLLLSPELNDRQLELRKAEAAEERAKTEHDTLLKRAANLSTIGVTNSELESQLRFKEAELRQLTQERETAAARLRMLLLGGELTTTEEGLPAIAVHARSAGTVRNVGITQGSWGEQGAPVIMMSNPAAMEIRGELYSGNIPTFTAVRATMTVGRENREVEGTWRLSEQADPEKQTRSLFFTPAALPEGAHVGQLCRLDLYDEGQPGEEASVSVPDSAVVRVGMDDIVFTEVGEGAYAAVKVRAGQSRRGMTPVKGLPQGHRIVTKGGQELRHLLPSAADGNKKPGHFHADGQFHEGED